MRTDTAYDLIMRRCEHRLDEIAEFVSCHLSQKPGGSFQFDPRAEAELRQRIADALAEELAPAGADLAATLENLRFALALREALDVDPSVFLNELRMRIASRTAQARELLSDAMPAGTA